MTPMYFRNSTSIGQNINAIHGSSNGDIPSTLSSLYVSKHTAKNTIDFYLKIRTNDFPKGSFINYINKRGDGVIECIVYTESGIGRIIKRICPVFLLAFT